jgi:hypothetical protein
MADNDDSTAGEAGNTDDQIAAAAGIYEGRLLGEAARIGLETLIGRATPATIAELNVILRLLVQAGDALETAQQAMFRLFGVQIGSA